MPLSLLPNCVFNMLQQKFRISRNQDSWALDITDHSDFTMLLFSIFFNNTFLILFVTFQIYSPFMMPILYGYSVARNSQVYVKGVLEC
jgi:hypothetical protein